MIALSAVVFALSWWLGLYLLGRDPRKPVLVLASLGLAFSRSPGLREDRAALRGTEAALPLRSRSPLDGMDERPSCASPAARSGTTATCPSWSPAR